MMPAGNLSLQGRPVRCILASDPGAVRDGLARLVAAPPLSGLPAGARASAELALAEVLNNIAEHAYAGAPGRITVTLTLTGQGVSCDIVDQGLEMPGGRLPPGRPLDTGALAPADLPEGGFGWGLIRALTRDLRYVRADGENRLSFLLPI